MALVELNEVTISKPSSSRLGGENRSERLVDRVSCELNAGEILTIIGPNGAGKSTLIKAIAGDLPHTGNIQIRGLSTDLQRRARQLAILPQQSLLDFPYRVSEVVGLSRIPHSTGIKRDREIVQHALRLMDIDYLAQRLYTELSGGEKQRVQLARVLAQIWTKEDAEHGTRVLLLDEPTAALDLGHQQQLMQAIQSFAQQGVAVLMVLHDVNLASHYSTKLLAMLCSQRIAFGTPKEVIDAKTIKQLFNVDTTVIQHPDTQSPVVIGI